jgi:UDP-N-acetyl-D-galactosamine dehydrogenase
MKLLNASGTGPGRGRVGVFGLTFKENVPDLRNSRVPDIKAELEDFGVAVLVHDPLADPEEALREYGIAVSALDEMRDLDAAVFAVGHEAYARMNLQGLRQRFAGPDQALLLDLKGLWARAEAEDAGFTYWRL